LAAVLLVSSCGVFKTTYNITKGTVTTSYRVVEGATKLTLGTGKVVYKVGAFTFHVVTAPLTWPLVREDLESIDGLPPKQAIRQGRVKNSPYIVNGRRYSPMTVEASRRYRQVGIASWYGYETLRRKGGHMTANGEVFDPAELNGAHRLLPLPTYVRVTNLDNHRQIIVRINDRGPFVKGRIIDLTAGGARRLGFYRQGTARVLVETVEVRG